MSAAANHGATHQADTLRRLREASGMSQRKLAIRAGVTSGMVSQVEAGQKRFGRDGLVKVAEALGVTVDALLPGQVAPGPSAAWLAHPTRARRAVLEQLADLEAATRREAEVAARAGAPGLAAEGLQRAEALATVLRMLGGGEA